MISWHVDDSCVALLSCNLYPLLPVSLIWGFLRPILCEELRCGNIFPKQVHPPTNVKNYIISINIRMSKAVTTKAQWLRPGQQFSFSTNNIGPGIGCDSRRQLLTRSFVLPFLERGRKRRGGKVWAAGNVLEVVGDSDKQAARTLRDAGKKRTSLFCNILSTKMVTTKITTGTQLTITIDKIDHCKYDYDCVKCTLGIC